MLPYQINSKYELQHGWFMDHNLCLIFKIILSKLLKTIKQWIYVSKIENRVILKINAWCYLELLTPETMKLLRSINNEITKDKKCENAPYLEITEAVLVHCHIFNNQYQ